MPDRPIDLAQYEIKLLKLQIEELKREIKKINTKLKALSSITEEREYERGWFW